MANEDLASQEAPVDDGQLDAAPVDQPIEEGGQPADDPIAKLASELGWTPKDQFRGDPEKWKGAEQFIRDGREIQQTTARELRAMREQVERIGGVTETIIRDKVAERDAYWQQQHAKAVDDGDQEAARKALDELRKPAPAAQQGGDPIVSAWVAKNEWFTKDPLAEARARELSERLKHLPVSEQLAQVDRAIRKEFPEHFPTAKTPPSTQTAASRNPNPSNRAKGFADMPAESQRIALDFETRHGTPKEKFAQSYWNEQQGVKR